MAQLTHATTTITTHIHQRLVQLTHTTTTITTQKHPHKLVSMRTQNYHTHHTYTDTTLTWLRLVLDILQCRPLIYYFPHCCQCPQTISNTVKVLSDRPFPTPSRCSVEARYASLTQKDTDLKIKSTEHLKAIFEYQFLFRSLSPVGDRQARLTKPVWTQKAGPGNVARGLALVCSQRHVHAVDVSQGSCALTSSSSSLSSCHSCCLQFSFSVQAFIATL